MRICEPGCRTEAAEVFHHGPLAVVRVVNAELLLGFAQDLGQLRGPEGGRERIVGIVWWWLPIERKYVMRRNGARREGM